MKSYFNVCLILLFFINNISYGQSYECDNNYGDCGTPNQSGGGGGGGGSVLIANTDLGDTYQHADDYDDDGIEDPSDNCPRHMNADQLDRDGDGIGDMCDNCLEVWNTNQENTDGDSFGDFCDIDIDNDNIENHVDDCPYHWGEDACFLSNITVAQNNSQFESIKDDKYEYQEKIFVDNKYLLKNNRSCNMNNSNQNFWVLITLIFFSRFRNLYGKRNF